MTEPAVSAATQSLPSTMQALVKARAAPGAVLQVVDVPHIGPHDVLIKVMAASICGTDLHLYEWDEWARGRMRPPQILGHEFAGEIAAVGDDVRGVNVGDYVAGESHVTCGHCYECAHGMRHICRNVAIIGVDRSGAFAEYIALPAINAWRTDRKFPPSIATIQEPMGNAVHTALSAPLAGSNVVIFGAGPIGLFAVPIARASGAKRVITVEPGSFRRQLASDLGSDFTIDPVSEDVVARLHGDTEGEGVDVVLEMSGHPSAIQQGFAALRSGGHVSLLGIPSRPVSLDLADGVIFKGAIVQGISGRRMFETWYQTRGFLESGMDLTAVVTHQMPLSEFETAFALVRSGQSGKVVMYPESLDAQSRETH